MRDDDDERTYEKNLPDTHGRTRARACLFCFRVVQHVVAVAVVGAGVGVVVVVVGRVVDASIVLFTRGYSTRTSSYQAAWYPPPAGSAGTREETARSAESVR